jgi:hypothetical protein
MFLIDRVRPPAAAKMCGSTEEGSKNWSSKNAEFSADFKNAKYTYAKCTYKKLFQKYMPHKDFQ